MLLKPPLKPPLKPLLKPPLQQPPLKPPLQPHMPSPTSGGLPTLLSLLILLLLTAGVASCSQPDFHDTQGRGYRYADFSGKWLVINYWATWCAPCITEIPELTSLNARYDEVLVWGVNYDQPDVQGMARDMVRMNISFPVYAQDPHQRLGIDRPIVLPTTFIFDPDGNFYRALVGPQTEATLLDAMGIRAVAP